MKDTEPQWEQQHFWRVLALFHRLFMHFLFFNLFHPLNLAFLACSGDFERGSGSGDFKNCSWAHWLEHFLGKWESSALVVPLLSQKKVESCVSHLQGKLVNNKIMMNRWARQHARLLNWNLSCLGPCQEWCEHAEWIRPPPKTTRSAGTSLFTSTWL